MSLFNVTVVIMELSLMEFVVILYPGNGDFLFSSLKDFINVQECTEDVCPFSRLSFDSRTPSLT